MPDPRKRIASASANADPSHGKPSQRARDIPQLNSFADPQEIKEGMVFALETYCPASNGYSAARIEEVLVTPKGAKVITLYQAAEQPIANPY